MPIIRNITRIILCATLVLGLAGCRSSKKAVAPDAGYTGTQTENRVKTMPEQFADLAGTYNTWTDVQVPVKIQIASPQRTSISGVAKLRKDECILISIRVFGFEVGSLYADKEAVQVYIKPMDIYWTEPLAELTDLYGLTLADLQSLLIGRPFITGSGTIKAADKGLFNYEALSRDNSAAGFTFAPKSQSRFATWRYTAKTTGNDALYLALMTITPKGYAPLDCVFSAPVMTEAGAVSNNVEAGTKIEGKEMQLSIKWSFDSAKWNSDLNISKTTPSKSAKKVETAQLLKMLKSL